MDTDTLVTPDAPVTSDTDPAVLPELADLSATQLHKWRLTGEFPDSKDSTDAVADSSPAPPEVPADAAAVPSPAKPDGQRREKRAAENRAPQIASEIESLIERRGRLLAEVEGLERLKTATPPAAPSPAPVTQPDYKRYLAMPDAPKLNNFDTLEEHSAAMSLFIADQRVADAIQQYANKTQQEQRTQQAQTERGKLLAEGQQRWQKERDADPTFATALSDEVLNLQSSAQIREIAGKRGLDANALIRPVHLIADRFEKSEVGPKLARYFSDHPQELARLDAYRESRSPEDFFLELGAIEASLKAHPAADTSAPPQTPRPTAPAPPPAIGSKARTEAVDAAQAALARGDFTAYRTEMNRREMAAAGRT